MPTSGTEHHTRSRGGKDWKQQHKQQHMRNRFLICMKQTENYQHERDIELWELTHDRVLYSAVHGANECQKLHNYKQEQQ